MVERSRRARGEADRRHISHFAFTGSSERSIAVVLSVMKQLTNQPTKVANLRHPDKVLADYHSAEGEKLYYWGRQGRIGHVRSSGELAVMHISDPLNDLGNDGNDSYVLCLLYALEPSLKANVLQEEGCSARALVPRPQTSLQGASTMARTLDYRWTNHEPNLKLLKYVIDIT
jgi:hypothetical protein